MKIALVILYVIICIVLSGIILLQEGKSKGLGGTIGGMGDSYWSKNKSRSVEGNLEKLTSFAAIGFMVIAFILNLIW